MYHALPPNFDHTDNEGRLTISVTWAEGGDEVSVSLWRPTGIVTVSSFHFSIFPGEYESDTQACLFHSPADFPGGW